jgi:hypothetical protein
MSRPVIRSFLLLLLLFALHVTPALAQSEGPTRVEENDPTVVYSGNWYSNGSSAHSGNRAALTNTNGARATITFNGTGITWMGMKDGWAGLANVYLDGTMTVVDTFGTGGYQQPMFMARGLAAGPHTLSIEVTHERGSQTQGSWVWIDYFLIDNGSPVPGGVTATGRVEESHAALLYSGRWYSNASAAHSSGRAALAMDAVSSVTVAFDGTGIAWIGYRDEWSGIARVFVDGVLKTTIDAYLAPARARATLYTIDALPAGAHTLRIEATGTRNESSRGSWMWVDSFDITR